MASASKRTWIIEEAVVRGPDDELHLDAQFDMERAQTLVLRLLGTLAEIGGMVAITADRVRTGEFRGEVMAESPRLIVTWQAFSPLRDAEDDREARADEMMEFLGAEPVETAVNNSGEYSEPEGDAWDVAPEESEDPPEVPAGPEPGEETPEQIAAREEAAEAEFIGAG